MPEATGSAMDLLPAEALHRLLSFVLCNVGSLASLCAVGRSFQRAVETPLSWQGASVCIGRDDLEASRKGFKHHRFERLLPLARLCSRAFLHFQGAQSPAQRFAAERCFLHLASDCPALSCLCVRSWCAFERNGLGVLSSAWLPSLRHVELTGCDHIGSYEAMIPFFLAHPELLSFHATFRPRATAGLSFVEALPRTLVALSFVKLSSAEALERLLSRCPLEHLWLAADGSLGRPSQGAQLPGRDLWLAADGSHARPLLGALLSGGGRLLTLAVPSDTSEESCLEIVRACAEVQLLCRMRLNPPAFGTGALAGDFEPLPGAQGVVVRRRGSEAGLAPNGSLWAPYAHDPGSVTSSEAPPA